MEFVYKNKKIKFDLPTGTGNVPRIIKLGRFYEKSFLDYVAKLDMGGTYVDVGGNIGNHTVYFGIFTRAEKVLSFEPHPKIYKYLVRNIMLNKLQSKIQPHNVALGDVNGMCSIAIEPSDEVGGSKTVKGKDIPQWKLDKFHKEDISLIKIDVEGYEENVLEGCKKILSSKHPELLIELTNKAQRKRVNHFLSQYGYKPIAAFNNSATYHFSSNIRPGILWQLTRFYPLRRIVFHS